MWNDQFVTTYNDVETKLDNFIKYRCGSDVDIIFTNMVIGSFDQYEDVFNHVEDVIDSIDTVLNCGVKMRSWNKFLSKGHKP